MAHRLRLSRDAIVVSKPGKDCLSGNYDDLILDASRRNTRAYMSGLLYNFTAYKQGNYNPQRYLYQLPHNLGYIPYCYAQSQGQENLLATIDGTYLNVWYLEDGATAATATFNNPSAISLSYVIFYDRLI